MKFDQEQSLLNQGYNLIAGVDEVGRGPLAGPVVAACVIFDPQIITGEKIIEFIEQIKDSKTLSAKKREQLFSLIKQEATAIGIGLCSPKTIDKINILQASLLACAKAVKQLNKQPDYILIDGRFTIPKMNIPQKAIIGGDNQVISIAAASIIAKVTRDYLMLRADKDYPGYALSQHKGYGTKLHLAKIKELGPSPIHRLSFAPLKNKK